MTHTVKSGETIGTIAAKYLGDKSRYTQILAVNPQITNPNLIKVGQVITIPSTTQSIVSVASAGQVVAARPAATAALVPVPVTPTPLISDAQVGAVAQGSLIERLKSKKGLIIMLLIGAGLYFYTTSQKKA